MQTVMFLQDYQRVAEKSTLKNRIEQCIKKITPAEEVHVKEPRESHWRLQAVNRRRKVDIEGNQ